MKHQNIALVSGANRGIGYGLSKALLKQNYKVLMLGKRPEALEQAASNLNSDQAIPIVFDLNNLENIASLYKTVQNHCSHLDLLINNAGILAGPEIGNADPLFQNSSLDIETQEHFFSAYTVNSLAPYYLSHALLPLLKQSPVQANVVNVSSRMGQLNQIMHSNYTAYRLSKTALNTVTKILAEDFKAFNINVNCISPGWVRTDMGSPYADRSVEEAIPGILWAAQLKDNKLSGQFFADGEAIPW